MNQLANDCVECDEVSPAPSKQVDKLPPVRARRWRCVDIVFVGALCTLAVLAGVQVIGCFTTSIGPQPRFSTLLAFADPNA